jgi:hypothetical protein
VVVAQLLSVVGRKDNDGVLKLAGAFQGGKNSPEIVVTFAARKRISFCESLYPRLSRACLGRMTVFELKSDIQDRFLT